VDAPDRGGRPGLREAGDAFVAGFLAGWLQARSLAGCAQWGNILGAQCVAAPGATAGVRGRAALLAQAAAAYGGAG